VAVAAKKPINGEAVRENLTSAKAALQEPVPGVLEHDPDAIHDMRVASRRTRAMLQEFGPLLPEEPREAVSIQVRDVTRGLGRARELDVMLGMLEDEREDFEGPWLLTIDHAVERLEAAREKAGPEVESAAGLVQSADFEQRFQELLDRIDGEAEVDLGAVSGRIQRRYKKVNKQYDQWCKKRSEEALHQTRIAFKKLRYTCEIYTPCYGKSMKKFGKELKTMHDLLGAWNDNRVLRDELDGLARNAPYRSVQGFPELIRRFDKRSGKRLKKFEKLAEDFFSKATRKRLEDML